MLYAASPNERGDEDQSIVSSTTAFSPTSEYLVSYYKSVGARAGRLGLLGQIPSSNEAGALSFQFGSCYSLRARELQQVECKPLHTTKIILRRRGNLAFHPSFIVPNLGEYFLVSCAGRSGQLWSLTERVSILRSIHRRHLKKKLDTDHSAATTTKKVCPPGCDNAQ